ncbi:LysR family transcriptional regulator [Photobacterium sp. BZF1]|uniref:LysR family transcriptional regulator n=1 Tax=Photobacterium sp. BZF1 TaxID=1904457 RepID=UPI001653A93F|nr:LysR family transcriptional regulator [Photobacterium sp. BZF1]MBC7003428.1 LysR family transcriptional regulator [Photobacterium sp. BZF1]
MRLKTTLDQWQTLLEIERAGSIQAAATSMNKSHTTLIYAVKKLEQQLGVPLIEVQKRRAVLTEDGKSLLRRANAMLEQAQELEEMSEQLSKGIESEITIAIDHLCDPAWLYQPMSEFLAHNSTTSVQVVETSLSKTKEMVTGEQADFAIINIPITNYPAEAFGVTTMVPVVAAHHHLAQKESLCFSELASTSQIVIRDLGGESDKSSKQDIGWLKSRQRITVDNFDHAFRAVERGGGFCRLPEHIVESRADGRIKVLNIENAERYQVPLHLTLPKGVKTGPAARYFYELLLDTSRSRVDQS